MLTMYNGREVEVYDIQFASEIEDCFILSASYVDNGDELNDTELDELTNDNQDLIYDEYTQNRVAAAEAYADSLEDR